MRAAPVAAAASRRVRGTVAVMRRSSPLRDVARQVPPTYRTVTKLWERSQEGIENVSRSGVWRVVGVVARPCSRVGGLGVRGDRSRCRATSRATRRLAVRLPTTGRRALDDRGSGVSSRFARSTTAGSRPRRGQASARSSCCSSASKSKRALPPRRGVRSGSTCGGGMNHTLAEVRGVVYPYVPAVVVDPMVTGLAEEDAVREIGRSVVAPPPSNVVDAGHAGRKAAHRAASVPFDEGESLSLREEALLASPVEHLAALAEHARDDSAARGHPACGCDADGLVDAVDPSRGPCPK